MTGPELIGAGALVLGVPTSVLAWVQITDRRERRRITEIHQAVNDMKDSAAKVEKQTRPSNGRTLAQLVEAQGVEQRAQRRELRQLRQTQLDMQRDQAGIREDQGSLAKALGSHLEASDEARRRLGLPPE